MGLCVIVLLGYHVCLVYIRTSFGIILPSLHTNISFLKSSGGNYVSSSSFTQVALRSELLIANKPNVIKPQKEYI